MIWLARSAASAAGSISVVGTARTGGALAEEHLGSASERKGPPRFILIHFFFSKCMPINDGQHSDW